MATYVFIYSISQYINVYLRMSVYKCAACVETNFRINFSWRICLYSYIYIWIEKPILYIYIHILILVDRCSLSLYIYLYVYWAHGPQSPRAHGALHGCARDVVKSYFKPNNWFSSNNLYFWYNISHVFEANSLFSSHRSYYWRTTQIFEANN